MVPGRSIVSKAASVSARMLRFNPGSPGLPAVWPSGKSRNTARGGQTDRVIEYALDSDKVGIPAASTCLAISPTD